MMDPSSEPQDIPGPAYDISLLGWSIPRPWNNPWIVFLKWSNRMSPHNWMARLPIPLTGIFLAKIWQKRYHPPCFFILIIISIQFHPALFILMLRSSQFPEQPIRAKERSSGVWGANFSSIFFGYHTQLNYLFSEVRARCLSYLSSQKFWHRFFVARS